MIKPRLYYPEIVCPHCELSCTHDYQHYMSEDKDVYCLPAIEYCDCPHCDKKIKVKMILSVVAMEISCAKVSNAIIKGNYTVEDEEIIAKYSELGNNKCAVARHFEVSETAIRRRLKKHGIS